MSQNQITPLPLTRRPGSKTVPPPDPPMTPASTTPVTNSSSTGATGAAPPSFTEPGTIRLPFDFVLNLKTRFGITDPAQVVSIYQQERNLRFQYERRHAAFSSAESPTIRRLPRNSAGIGQQPTEAAGITFQPHRAGSAGPSLNAPHSQHQLPHIQGGWPTRTTDAPPKAPRKTLREHILTTPNNTKTVSGARQRSGARRLTRGDGVARPKQCNKPHNNTPPAKEFTRRARHTIASSQLRGGADSEDQNDSDNDEARPPPTKKSNLETLREKVMSAQQSSDVKKDAPSQYIPRPAAPSLYGPSQHTPRQYISPYGPSPFGPSQNGPIQYTPRQYPPNQFFSQQYAPRKYGPSPYGPSQHAPGPPSKSQPISVPEPAARKRRTAPDPDDFFDSETPKSQAPRRSTRVIVQAKPAQYGTGQPSNRASPDPEPEKPLIPPSFLDARYPPELEGTRIAIGERNWAEYVKLMGLFVEGEIGEMEMERKAGVLFQVHDEAARKVIRKLVREMVVEIKRHEEEMAGEEMAGEETAAEETAGEDAAEKDGDGEVIR